MISSEFTKRCPKCKKVKNRVEFERIDLHVLFLVPQFDRTDLLVREFTVCNKCVGV